MSHADDMRAIRDHFLGAVARGDIEAVRAMYAPDAVIWHNNDGVSQTPDENLRVLTWIAANVTDFRYKDVRFQATDSGFVEQHVTCGTSPSGKPFSIPACLVVRVVDGKIARLDEYLDSAQTAAIVA